MKTLKNIKLSDFDLEEEFDDDIFVELSAAGDGSRASKTFNSATSNWASVGAALSALVSKGPGNATNGYTELKCC